jgi:hypothetical protein
MRTEERRANLMPQFFLVVLVKFRKFEGVS